jgi:hypothetical protein
MTRTGGSRGVSTVLQPAVAIGGERYRGRDRDVEAVREVTDEAVEVRRRLLGYRHGGAHRRTRPDDHRADGHGEEQRKDGHRHEDPACRVPAGATGSARGTGDEEHYGDRCGKQGDSQRGAADPQYCQGLGTREVRARLRADRFGHDRRSPPSGYRTMVWFVAACYPPTVALGADIAMPVRPVAGRTADTPQGVPAGHTSWGVNARQPYGSPVTRWNGFGQSLFCRDRSRASPSKGGVCGQNGPIEDGAQARAPPVCRPRRLPPTTLSSGGPHAGTA